MTEYKADTTKGRSMINPLNYKGDVNVQVWIDSRTLATLMKWLDSQGIYCQHMSHVLRRPLELLCDMLVDAGDVTPVDDTVEARTLLQGRFNINLNRGNKGEKNVMHNILLSNRRKELAEQIGKQRADDINVPSRRGGVRVDMEDIEKMLNDPKVQQRAEELRKMRGEDE